MSRETKPPMLSSHIAVHLAGSVVVFGGFSQDKQPCKSSDIWVYNLYTDIWRKYMIPNRGNTVPPRRIYGGCGVANNNTDIYVVGLANLTNYKSKLWKLTRTRKGGFSWVEVTVRKAPLRRRCPTGWAYAEKVWIFGGCGPSQTRFVHLLSSREDGNQGSYDPLICFDPTSQKWTNVRCSGTVPSSQNDWHSSTINQDKVLAVWRIERCQYHIKWLVRT